MKGEKQQLCVELQGAATAIDHSTSSQQLRPPLQLASCPPPCLPPQEEFYGKEVIVADREMVEMVRLPGGWWVG